MSGLGQAARASASELAHTEPKHKNAALLQIAAVLDQRRDFVLQENRTDLDAAQQDRLSPALLERLELDQVRIDAMIEGLRQVANLPDPVGEISDLRYRPSGIQVGKMRVPLGVIGIIYESRPNVTVDAAALCLKSGNASILRGGKEALHSNQAIYQCIQQGLQQAGLTAGAVQVVNTADREAVAQMLRMHESIDVIIPRGGKSLIERISNDSLIPVIKHLDGVCHVYIDDHADRQKALDIAVNAKTRRYGVCNAMESLLVGAGIAPRVMPEIIELMCARGVELRGCERSRAFDDARIGPASEDDWYTEYLAPILSMRIVDGLEQAIEHINHYGSQHTDAIVSEDYSHVREFLRRVDSSSVMVN
ncbi:MAG: glutamate-5-semialdehyde dehydrogenase, partial [Gammaproteobacteria bacterium]|nr:glutamate-5-semialdehyde dehydrogenase [Gammaproteobacteria bacterium]